MFISSRKTRFVATAEVTDRAGKRHSCVTRCSCQIVSEGGEASIDTPLPSRAETHVEDTLMNQRRNWVTELEVLVRLWRLDAETFRGY